MVEALEQEKAQLKNEFDTCDTRRSKLEHLMEALEVGGGNIASQISRASQGCTATHTPPVPTA